MKTRTDIQRELLFKLDELCRQNGLHYVLDREAALAVFRGGDLADNMGDVSVLMTMGDTERLYEAVCKEHSNQYYLEFFLNNDKAKTYKIRFGDRNTTEIALMPNRSHEYHGIYITIRLINRIAPEKARKALRRNRELVRGLHINNQSEGNRKKAVLGRIYNTGVRVYGRERYKQALYNTRKKKIGIDHWHDILQQDFVDADSRMLSGVLFAGIQTVTVHGHTVSQLEKVEEYLKEFYKDLETATVKRFRDEAHIFDTAVPYETSLKLLKDSEPFKKANAACDVDRLLSDKGRPYRKKANEGYRTYLLAKNWVELNDELSQNEQTLKAIAFPADYEQADWLLQPYLDMKQKWEEKGFLCPDIDVAEALLARKSSFEEAHPEIKEQFLLAQARANVVLDSVAEEQQEREQQMERDSEITEKE